MRKCPRTLDKPVLLFGLEMEDVAILSAVVGVGSLLFGPMIPGIGGMVGWVVLLKSKGNKPAGFLLHWLYSKGYECPGLIAPVNKVNTYAAIRSTMV